MKKISLLFVIIPVFGILIAFTSGPQAGYTGSPLDGENCTSCHTPLPLGFMEGWITSDVPVTGYTPKEFYTVTVSAPGIVAVKMGFQVTSEVPGSKAGIFSIIDPDRTQLRGDYTATHTAAGTAITELPASWTMQWQAPEEGAGDVTFYATINQSNNDNSNSGDLIFGSTLTVQESNTGIAELKPEEVGIIYPNPANEYIYVKAPAQSIIRIYDGQGRCTEEVQANENLSKIDVGNLVPGVYYLQTSYDRIFRTNKFIKN